MFQLGIHAVISLIIYFVSVAFSFQAVKSIKIEKFTNRGHIFEKQILLLFLAIALGYLVASFVINLLDFSLQLSNFF